MKKKPNRNRFFLRMALPSWVHLSPVLVYWASFSCFSSSSFSSLCLAQLWLWSFSFWGELLEKENFPRSFLRKRMFLGAHLEAFVSVQTGLSQGGDRHCQSLLIPRTHSHHDVKKTTYFTELSSIKRTLLARSPT